MPLDGGEINHTWPPSTEYQSAIERNEAQTSVTAWMNPENILPGERS